LRQIVLDTETTGIGHEAGHRIIEIGCLEMIDRTLTGERFHTYLNPERNVDEGAFRVHGIGTAFLQDKPTFREIVPTFLRFIDGATLIIHNAPFDVGFLNAELKKSQWPSVLEDHALILDTLVLARKKHPGQRNSLDALCKRYGVDHSNRQLHGALLDAEILAHVYLAMTGGQARLLLDEEERAVDANSSVGVLPMTLSSNSPVQYATADELVKHQQFIETLIKKSGKNLWEE
jgi:DNA polymerase-3 subunit epsilon